ncbi:MAG: ABC transporter substrate-binding protein [Pseudomonadota bacterium]
MTNSFAKIPGVFGIVVAAAIAMGATSPAARAADPDMARQTAEVLIVDAHGALADAGLSSDERDTRLKQAVSDAFAFDVWERFLLGDRIDQFEDEQLAAFRDLLPGFLAKLYLDQFGKGLEAKPEIQDARKARRDVLVRAQIPRANGKTLPVDWRIRDFDGRGHLVIDVMVGGTSFLILKRDEFAAILENGGPDALLEHMRANAV